MVKVCFSLARTRAKTPPLAPGLVAAQVASALSAWPAVPLLLPTAMTKTDPALTVPLRAQVLEARPGALCLGERYCRLRPSSARSAPVGLASSTNLSW